VINGPVICSIVLRTPEQGATPYRRMAPKNHEKDADVPTTEHLPDVGCTLSAAAG
jgi:hypothetical protein